MQNNPRKQDIIQELRDKRHDVTELCTEAEAVNEPHTGSGIVTDCLYLNVRNPPFGSRGSSPFLYRTVDRTALAEEKPTGHSLVHFGPGLALEHPAALERL